VLIVLAICRLVNIWNIENSNEETKGKKITYGTITNGDNEM
jgi:hypothetical protein